MLRVRTTGIVNTEIEIKNEKIKLVDIGGQLNERKKWKFCFENLSAVVFVVALSYVQHSCKNAKRILYVTCTENTTKLCLKTNR